MLLPDTLEVEVTQQDINDSMAGRSFSCPIALACNRILVPLKAQATVEIVYFFDPGSDAPDKLIDLEKWGNPIAKYKHNAAYFVGHYDEGRIVEPRTITLERIFEQCEL